MTTTNINIANNNETDQSYNGSVTAQTVNGGFIIGGLENVNSGTTVVHTIFPNTWYGELAEEFGSKLLEPIINAAGAYDSWKEDSEAYARNGMEGVYDAFIGRAGSIAVASTEGAALAVAAKYGIDIAYAAAQSMGIRMAMSDAIRASMGNIVADGFEAAAAGLGEALASGATAEALAVAAAAIIGAGAAAIVAAAIVAGAGGLPMIKS